MFRSGSIYGRICKRFPVGRRPPSLGIDLYHFRRNDIKVLTFSLVSRSGVPSSLAFGGSYIFFHWLARYDSFLFHRDLPALFCLVLFSFKQVLS